MTPEKREQLITILIEARIQSLYNSSSTYEWLSDAMFYGWQGYKDHTDDELIDSADMWGWEELGLKREDFVEVAHG